MRKRMARKIINDDSIILWHDFVKDSASAAGENIIIDVERYLVFLLNENMFQAAICDEVMCIEYMKCLQNITNNKAHLQRVADSCLLLCGFFPDNISAKGLDTEYYANLGVSAYNNLSSICLQKKQSSGLVYSDMAKGFYCSVRVLSYMRSSSAQDLRP
jgi:hypothetical protein